MDDAINPYDDQLMDMEPNPPIYSQKAIIGFTLFFSSIFGAVLLMQNLKDIGKKKEANLLLLLAIFYSVLSVIIIDIPDRPNFFLTYLCNFIGAMILIEFVYKKFIPDDEAFEKKNIRKPLIISFLIIIPFVLIQIFTM